MILQTPKAEFLSKQKSFMKKFLPLFLMLGTAMAFAPKAGAAQCPSCRLLTGKYYFNVSGEAVVDTTATTGSCEQTGSVAAGFTRGELEFDGHGDILPVRHLGTLSIGATSCIGFGIVGGSYSVVDRGDDTFEATGIMDFASNNVHSPCSNASGQLALGNQPFVITGHIGARSLEIRTNGADTAATYAEGSSGRLTCTAAIQNFITEGLINKGSY